MGGALLTALISRPFAAALSAQLGDAWALGLYDRRGLGKSTGQPAGHCVDTKIAYVASYWERTGHRTPLAIPGCRGRQHGRTQLPEPRESLWRTLGPPAPGQLRFGDQPRFLNRLGVAECIFR